VELSTTVTENVDYMKPVHRSCLPRKLSKSQTMWHVIKNSLTIYQIRWLFQVYKIPWQFQVLQVWRNLDLSVWSEVQMTCIWSSWCHCHPNISCFITTQIGLTFLLPA